MHDPLQAWIILGGNGRAAYAGRFVCKSVVRGLRLLDSAGQDERHYPRRSARINELVNVGEKVMTGDRAECIVVTACAGRKAATYVSLITITRLVPADLTLATQL